MKLLLVLDSADQYYRITEYVKTLGFDIIWYRHILKAMDNLEEIAPDGIFISAVDFPRHWKTLISFFRSTHHSSDSPVVLIHGKKFTEKEMEKAKYLDINCLLSESFTDEDESLDKLRRVLQATIPVEKWLDNVKNTQIPSKQLAMVITNPSTGAIVPGKIRKITNFGAVFASDYSSLIKDIKADTILNSCSLRVGGSILSPVCKVVNNSETTSLEFVSFEKGEKSVLDQFLTHII
ncbi:MAG: hypothetical protein Ta2G_13780 [Termitinemataceae bacterium]|nr:MAG: hypothetical protein Ta2G_13780 [Termitinemataceae bacterium]